jgi:hypothetical protein
MSTSVQDAAAALLSLIEAPKGSVNTYGCCDGDGPAIHVMIDPLYWNAVHDVPTSYEGYRVIVEKREATIAFH